MKHPDKRQALRPGVLLAVGCVLAGLAMAGADTAAGEKEHREKITEALREVEIMASVLEERLEQQGGDLAANVLPGTSAFAPRIESDYIPGVGAIFTVPVGFLISDPNEKIQEERKDEGESVDLWDRMVTRRAREATEDEIRRLSAPGTPYVTAPWQLESRKKYLVKSRQSLEKLREALLATVATYAHRMRQVDLTQEKLVFRVRQAAVGEGFEYEPSAAARILRSQPDDRNAAAGQRTRLVSDCVIVVAGVRLSGPVSTAELADSAEIKEYYYCDAAKLSDTVERRREALRSLRKQLQHTREDTDEEWLHPFSD